MYEYTVETMEIPAKFFKQAPNPKELNGLIEMINQKAESGWELVTNTFMGAGDLQVTQTFLCTFKRKKK